MSLITKIKPVGVDAYIDRLQRKMYTVLKEKWSIADDVQFNCTPRCYRNQLDAGYVAELFIGGITGNDYKEIYFDDTISVTSFFGLATEENINADNSNIATVHLIFFVNLKKIKPGTDRNDLEVRNDVEQIVNTYGAARGFLLTKEITGIENVLKEYSGSRQTLLKFKADMHPNHCFRFDMQLINYQPTLEECGGN